MKRLSRRDILKAGGALGALGALNGLTPAWAWDQGQSVLGGSGATLPPEDVWDDDADPIVRRLFEEEGIQTIEQINALLRPWNRNDEPLPAGLPPYLADFIEAEARQLPAWIDHGKLADAFAFYERRGSYTGLLYGLGSGIMSCAIPDEALAVYHSKGGEDMRSRIARTAKLGYDIGTEDAFQPSGEMIVTCVKVRLVHSAVRHLITSSARWHASAGSLTEQEPHAAPSSDRGRGRGPRRSAPEGPLAPISQRDLIITWHSLGTFIHKTLEAWGVDVAPAHSEGFLHLWQVTAHMLGIRDEYIPATWADARAQSDLTLDPVLGATPEGLALADILLSMVGEQGPPRAAVNAMARYMTGTNNAGVSIGDMLQIPEDPFWDRSIREGWPHFVRGREGSLAIPLSPQVYWTFDELLRQGALMSLNGGPGPISIEIPTANRSEGSYPDGY